MALLVSGCFTSIKKSLRFSENFRFCSRASARFLKMKRYSRKRNVLNNLGRVKSFTAGGSLEIVGSICGKGSLAGAGPWIPKAFEEAKAIRDKGISELLMAWLEVGDER